MGVTKHSRRYMIHYVMGHLLWSRGGDNAQGCTARSLSSRAVALRHANASCKTWRYGQPNYGEETFWPEPVVELRDQGTGVLRALALVEKMGGPWTFVLKVDQDLNCEAGR